MGFPMAGHLRPRPRGHGLQSDAAQADGVVRALPGRARRHAHARRRGRAEVISCVGNDDDLRSVVLGADGILAGWRRGVLSTTRRRRPMSPESCSRPAGQGEHFIDAPVSGGQAGAENGTLTVMCGGEPDHSPGPSRCCEAYGRGGDPHGSGRARSAHQDGQPDLHRRPPAGAGGGDRVHAAGRPRPGQVLATISKGAAQSWQMDNRWPTMAAGKFDFGFAVDWMRKDLGDCARRGPAQRLAPCRSPHSSTSSIA